MEPIGAFSGLASGIQWRDMVDEIMRLDRARRVGPLTSQVTTQQKRLEAWSHIQIQVSKLNAAAKALRDGTAFDAYRVSGGTTAAGRVLVGATASGSASPGSYTVEVLSLARAEKLSSAAQSSVADPLGLTGRLDGEGAPIPLTFTINGVEIELAQDASLNDIRDAINRVNTGASPSGVAATVLTTAAGEHRLILTAGSTGTAGIRLQDGEDEVLAQLGISAGSTSRQFTGAMEGDPPSPLATILGLSSPPAVRTIVVDGQEVQVDLSTDTLQGLLDKIRAAAVAAGRDPLSAASIVAEDDGQGGTVHRLEVAGSVVGKWDDVDTRAVLDALAFTRPNTITAGTDAQFTIDGFAMTRRANSVSDALGGVTLKLQQAEAGSPVEVRIARDVDRAVESVKAFAFAYNELVAGVRQVTSAGQPLSRSGALKTALGSITNSLLTALEGTEEEPFTLTRATLVGVSLTRTGSLEVDEGALRDAIASRPEDVRRLFTGYENGPVGLAGKVVAITESITRSGDGLIAGQTDSLQRSIELLNRRASDAEARLELRRESMIRQFTRMEEVLSRMQAQSSWLASQIQALQPRETR